MKGGHYLWPAFVVVFVALVVTGFVTNLGEGRDLLQQIFLNFLKRPLISQIIIGFVVWLILMIVPLFVYSHLVEPFDEGGVR